VDWAMLWIIAFPFALDSPAVHTAGVFKLEPIRKTAIIPDRQFLGFENS